MNCWLKINFLENFQIHEKSSEKSMLSLFLFLVKSDQSFSEMNKNWKKLQQIEKFWRKILVVWNFLNCDWKNQRVFYQNFRRNYWNYCMKKKSFFKKLPKCDLIRMKNCAWHVSEIWETCHWILFRWILIQSICAQTSIYKCYSFFINEWSLFFNIQNSW